MRRLVFALSLAVVVPPPAPAQDPLAVGPDIYKLLLDNPRVRVLEATFKPGAEIAYHWHPEATVQIVKGGRMLLSDKEGKGTEATFVAGEVIWSAAEGHSAKNVGRTTVQAIVTELKEPPASPEMTDAERQAILDLLDRGRTELETLVARTPDELWAKKPAPERWSVGEVVEHIAVVEPFLLGMAQQALAAPPDPNWAMVEARVSAESVATMVQDRSKRFQAPEPVQPKGGLSRAEALAKYGASRAVTDEFVRRVRQPVKQHVSDGTPLGKMTAHQLLVFLASHNLRHNQQIAEALEQLQKP
jgi:quercetin dioxygenase-like cupin family protein/uncharacterized damage-inducible protein DinB